MFPGRASVSRWLWSQGPALASLPHLCCPISPAWRRQALTPVNSDLTWTLKSLLGLGHPFPHRMTLSSLGPSINDPCSSWVIFKNLLIILWPFSAYNPYGAFLYSQNNILAHDWFLPTFPFSLSVSLTPHSACFTSFWRTRSPSHSMVFDWYYSHTSSIIRLLFFRSWLKLHVLRQVFPTLPVTLILVQNYTFTSFLIYSVSTARSWNSIKVGIMPTSFNLITLTPRKPGL